MSKLQQRSLRNDVCQAEKTLDNIASDQGRTSPEYRDALQRFVRLWSVLRMTRSKDEFFREVTKKLNQN